MHISLDVGALDTPGSAASFGARKSFSITRGSTLSATLVPIDPSQLLRSEFSRLQARWARGSSQEVFGSSRARAPYGPRAAENGDAAGIQVRSRRFTSDAKVPCGCRPSYWLPRYTPQKHENSAVPRRRVWVRRCLLGSVEGMDVSKGSGEAETMAGSKDQAGGSRRRRALRPSCVWKTRGTPLAFN